MSWRNGYIAVDWGTTNRRAYSIGSGGELVGELADDCGVLSVPAGGFDAAVAELRARLGEKPLLLAGMVGSNRGWAEAPYVDCPAGIDDLVAAIHYVRDDMAIVPGVRLNRPEAADVMRGEELQILGAARARLIPQHGLACHPGTHAKWVLLDGGRISRFRTLMTGELFALLKQHSILAEQLRGPVRPDRAFLSGVDRALDQDSMLADLFSVRARFLLGQASDDEGASYASGLLIGGDVRIGLQLGPDRPLAFIGRPDLTALYAAALGVLDRKAVEVDGKDAFLAGARAIAERL